MRYKVINKILTAAMVVQGLTLAAYGQSVSNKPNNQTQVPGPTTTVATPPGSGRKRGTPTLLTC